MALFDYSNPLAFNGQQYVAGSSEARAIQKARADIMAQGGMRYFKDGKQITPEQVRAEGQAELDKKRAKLLNPDLIKVSKNPALSAITDTLTSSLAGMVKGQGAVDRASLADQRGLVDRMRGFADEDISAASQNVNTYAANSEALRAKEEALAGRARDISYGKANAFMERYGAKSPGMGVGTELYNAAGAAFAPVELDYLKSVSAANRESLNNITNLRQGLIGKRGALISGVADRVRDLSYEPSKLAGAYYPALGNLTNLNNAQNITGVGDETYLEPFTLPSPMGRNFATPRNNYSRASSNPALNATRPANAAPPPPPPPLPNTPRGRQRSAAEDAYAVEFGSYPNEDPGWSTSEDRRKFFVANGGRIGPRTL